MAKTRKNHLYGNILKIVLIVVTIGIYTFGPVLNNYANWIPGVQFDYKDGPNGTEFNTGADFYEFGIKSNGKTKVYEQMKNGASSFDFISTFLKFNNILN